VIPSRELLDKEIDQLTPQSLEELHQFVAYLRYKQKQQGSPWLRELYDAFAPVREAVEQSGMTEEEINIMIDEAIDEVRREQRNG
jgi:hypothetical protein